VAYTFPIHRLTAPLRYCSTPMTEVRGTSSSRYGETTN
jgi:hypothetical protein